MFLDFLGGRNSDAFAGLSNESVRLLFWGLAHQGIQPDSRADLGDVNGVNWSFFLAMGLEGNWGRV